MLLSLLTKKKSQISHSSLSGPISASPVLLQKGHHGCSPCELCTEQAAGVGRELKTVNCDQKSPVPFSMETRKRWEFR